MEVVVTGAAGYVGSHVCDALLAQGARVIGLDNLSTGRREFVSDRVNLKIGDACNQNFVRDVFASLEEPAKAGVIHCAGLKFAGESVKNPLAYYEANSHGVLSVLQAMKATNIQNLVFSSSCSVYGNSLSGLAVTEESEMQPVSPYGRSKYFAEKIIQDAVNEGWLNATSLRYFNVAGNATINAYDVSPYNLLPNLYRAISAQGEMTIFGNDFETPDGTCIRDYVDVRLLANAHVKVLNDLAAGRRLSFAYNLGSGSGSSVLEIIDIARREIFPSLRIIHAPRRTGDPAQILADISLAQDEISWTHNIPTMEMVLSGWQSWTKNN